MSRLSYIIPFTVTSPTTTPFLQLATPAGTGLEIVELFIGQETSETSEQAAVTIQRRSTASTLPTTATVSPLDPTAPATKLATTTTTNAYGIATGTGTAGALLHRLNFNFLSGVLYVPVPEARIEMDVSQFLTLQFVATPTAGLVVSGYIVFNET